MPIYTHPALTRSRIYLKKKVKSIQRICIPSWSASESMITFLYFDFSTSKERLKPAPIAEISVFISSFCKACKAVFFCTFKGLPLKGKMDWNCLTLACFAVPPAESPSTMKSSFSSGFLPEHAASLPTRLSPSFSEAALATSLSARCLILSSAANLAFCAILSNTALLPLSAISFCKPSITVCSTGSFTSGLPNFVLVCPSNCTLFILTVKTAVRPSFTSSATKGLSLAFKKPLFLA